MSALQELLNLGLVRIGPDDSIFERIKATSSAFVQKLREEPSLLIPATLIALDGDVHEEAPLFALIEELLIQEWNTLRNTHVNRPRELLRSIIIDALSEASSSSAEAAGVVWNAGASRLRHGHVRIGKAKHVVREILNSASDRAETEAVHRAGLVGPISEISRKTPVSGSASLSVDAAIEEDEVIMNVFRAAGPSNREGKTLNDPNPNWPNGADEWSYEFAPRMTVAIVDAVNLGIDRLIKSFGEKIPGELISFENRLREQLREVVQFHRTSQLRLDVLWWSESLYSPSQRLGYRDLPPSVAAVAAAVDLAAIVPPLAPASVCYVLFEAVLRISGILNDTGDRPIVNHLENLSSAKIDFGGELLDSITEDSYVPLLCLIAEASTGRGVLLEELHFRTGVDGSRDLSAPEFAMWIFRDIQARRLVDELP